MKKEGKYTSDKFCKLFETNKMIGVFAAYHCFMIGRLYGFSEVYTKEQMEEYIHIGHELFLSRWSKSVL